jgi:hypothetical protein
MQKKERMHLILSKHSPYKDPAVMIACEYGSIAPDALSVAIT